MIILSLCYVFITYKLYCVKPKVIGLSHKTLTNIILSFVHTMVYVANPSWHIPYGMKLWLDYAKEGFDGGFIQNHRCWGLDYMDVGKNHIDGGRQGGTFMDPWDGGK